MPSRRSATERSLRVCLCMVGTRVSCAKAAELTDRDAVLVADEIM